MAANRIDWPKVLDDIAYLAGEPDPSNADLRVPCTQRQLATVVGIDRGTLRGWMDGSEPKYRDGEMLLTLWCRMSGKAWVFAPRERQQLSAAGR